MDGGEIHQVKTQAIVVNQGVFVAECVSADESKTEFDIMLPISSMIMYESE